MRSEHFWGFCVFRVFRGLDLRELRYKKCIFRSNSVLAADKHIACTPDRFDEMGLVDKTSTRLLNWRFDVLEPSWVSETGWP